MDGLWGKIYENLIRMVDLGVPPFQETSRWPRQDIFPTIDGEPRSNFTGFQCWGRGLCWVVTNIWKIEPNCTEIPSCQCTIVRWIYYITLTFYMHILVTSVTCTLCSCVFCCCHLGIMHRNACGICIKIIFVSKKSFRSRNADGICIQVTLAQHREMLQITQFAGDAISPPRIPVVRNKPSAREQFQIRPPGVDWISDSEELQLATRSLCALGRIGAFCALGRTSTSILGIWTAAGPRASPAKGRLPGWAFCRFGFRMTEIMQNSICIFRGTSWFSCPWGQTILSNSPDPQTIWL